MIIETPAKREKTLWYYSYKLTNKTDAPQQAELTRFDTIVEVKLDLTVTRKMNSVDPDSGRATSKPVTKSFDGDVEVALIDEGKSTIHKAQVMNEMGTEFKADRFFKGVLAAGKSAEGVVIFDETEVDWEPIYEHIQSKLNIQGFESTLENPQKLEDFYVRARPPLVVLTDEEKAKVREQVLAAIPDKLEDRRGDKRIVADVTGKAGIASGTFRIRRSYFKPGEIKEHWINKWEIYR